MHYEKYASVMDSWNIPRIREALNEEDTALKILSIGQSHSADEGMDHRGRQLHSEKSHADAPKLKDSHKSPGSCGNLLFGRKSLLRLPLLHFPPAEKAVNVVCQKSGKAHGYGNIPCVLKACQHPQHNENDIIGSIGQGKPGTSAKGQVHRKEAGGHGQGAGDQVGGAEILQDPVKSGGHHRRKSQHDPNLPLANGVDRYLGLVAPEGVFQPGDQGKHRHRHGHAQVGDHFPVVGKAVRNDAIQQAENHHQHLADGIALGGEDQRCHPHQGSEQGQIALPVKEKKEDRDQSSGSTPKKQLSLCKVA